MPSWFGPVSFIRVLVSPREKDPAVRMLFRHYGGQPEGRNVYILTDGTVTENDQSDQTLVARTLFGGHYETVTDAEALLLTAAGYGAYLS